MTAKDEIAQKEEKYAADKREFIEYCIREGESRENNLRRAAMALEKAGTVETHHIAARLIDDLKRKIEGNWVTVTWILETLEEKYKHKMSTDEVPKAG